MIKTGYFLWVLRSIHSSLDGRQRDSKSLSIAIDSSFWHGRKEVPNRCQFHWQSSWKWPFNWRNRIIIAIRFDDVFGFIAIQTTDRINSIRWRNDLWTPAVLQRHSYTDRYHLCANCLQFDKLKRKKRWDLFLWIFERCFFGTSFWHHSQKSQKLY